MSAFKENKYLKADARESLLGNLTTTVISIFLYMLSTMTLSELIANFRSGSILISLLLSMVVFFVVNTCANMLRLGLSCIFLSLQFGRTARIRDLLYAFRNDSNTAVIISAFIAVLELACMMPVFLFLTFFSAQDIPGYQVIYLLLFLSGLIGTIAIRIRYAMCSYLFLDFSGFTAEELIRGGTKLIRGHLGRLFRLYLSFIPLYILSVLSFGVASLWVSSYTHAAEAAFYKDLMANTAF